MAINTNSLGRTSDKRLFLAAIIVFPLLVLIGFSRSYYFSPFFDLKPLANTLLHFHCAIMTIWVIFFTSQIILIRSKNIKLHRTMGMVGIALAVLVVIVGIATTYDAQLIRASAPVGISPRMFFAIPVFDMLMFAIFFAGAIYYRKRPAEHKSLMLMTAINFLPAAVARIPIVPDDFVILWMYALPDLIALVCLVFYTFQHRKLNKIFAVSVLLFILSQPLRLAIASTEIWIQFTAWLTS